VFSHQSEPSKAPGLPVFESLTLGFAVTDQVGAPVATLVDDLTLAADLNRAAAPLAGWHRILSDDPRLLRLAARHCDPQAPLESVLEPLAALFGGGCETHPGGVVRASDTRGAPLAMAAPLPGERERPCEIVTAPLTHDHAAALGVLLDEARALGCTLPREGATHLHFDAARLCSAPVLARLVAALTQAGPALKQKFKTNPNCVRLGPWPHDLCALTDSWDFQALDWPGAIAALKPLGLSKYVDFNLANLIGADPAKHTFEVRILPAHLDPAPILAAAAWFEALLAWCCDPQRAPPPPL
jgi:hypothetical protein